MLLSHFHCPSSIFKVKRRSISLVVGYFASNGAILSIAYVWDEGDLETTTIRVISARKATKAKSVTMKRAYER